MEKNKLKLLIIAISVICLTCLIFLLVFSSQVSVSDILPEEKILNKNYYLESLDYSSFDSSDFEFPYITIRPDKSDLDKESNLTKKGISDPLEISTRRLVQIYNWKDEYYFKNRSLIREDNETAVLSWEDILSDYFGLLKIKNELIKKENLSLYEEKADYLKMRMVINIHYPVFFQIINGINKSNEKKQYLAQIVNDNFKQILQELKVEDTSYNPIEYVFSLREIDKYSDYGKYRLTLLNNYISLNNNIKLYFNQNEIKNIPGNYKGESGLIYEEIYLTGKQDKISIIIDDNSPTSESKWYESVLPDGRYLYQIKLPINEINKKYYLSLDAIIPGEGQFWIDETYFDNLSNLFKTVNIENPINFQKDILIAYKKKILLPDKNNKKDINLNVISKVKLTNEIFKGLKLVWVPIYDPVLLAEKIIDKNTEKSIMNIVKRGKNKYLLEIHNVNEEVLKGIKDNLQASWHIKSETINGNLILIGIVNKQYKIFMNIFIALLTVVILLSLTEICSRFKICNKTKLLFKIIYLKLSSQIVIFVKKFKWLFLLLVIITFMISVINYKDVSGKLYLLFMFGLIFSSFSFSISSELLLSVFIVFVLLSCGFRILIKLNIAEWFAVWSYVLLLSIILIEIVNKNQNKNKLFEKLYKKIINYITEMAK